MAIPEVVEHTVPMALEHLGVNVEARVPEFGNLLGQELHSVDRVTENDGLIDAQLQELNNNAESEIIRVDKACIPSRMEMGRGDRLLGSTALLQTPTLEKRVLRQWTFCRSSTNA